MIQLHQSYICKCTIFVRIACFSGYESILQDGKNNGVRLPAAQLLLVYVGIAMHKRRHSRVKDMLDLLLNACSSETIRILMTALLQHVGQSLSITRYMSILHQDNMSSSKNRVVRYVRCQQFLFDP